MSDPAAKQKKRPALSSPEQLDQLLQVAGPGGWIALGALCLILITAIVWSIAGRIPTKVDGAGMLIRTGGVLDVVSLGQGQIASLKVFSGDMVRKGQLVATLAQPSLQAQVINARDELNQLTEQQEKLRRFYAKQDKLQKRLTDEQERNTLAAISDLDERARWLGKRIKAQQELLDKGLITSQTLMNTRAQLMNVKEQKSQRQADLKGLEDQFLKYLNQQERELAQGDLQILQARGKLDLLQSEMKLRAKVYSKYSGRVLELKTRVGSEVNIGTPLFSLERMDKVLLAVAYTPAAHGKRIKKGMRIEITPSTVKRDEYGYMIGKVISASPFPATEQGMMAVLQNEELVKEFSAQGAPIAVYAELLKKPETFSGYKWSSDNGPPQKIYSGTVATVQVVVDKQPPIQLVIPYFKSLLGL